MTVQHGLDASHGTQQQLQRLPNFELTCTVLLLQGHMGLHGRLVDSESFTPINAFIDVTQPSHHRSLNITDDNGEFFHLLAPDVVYCLTIQPIHPEGRHTYHPLYIAALLLDAKRIIHGHGFSGITLRQVFFAERVYGPDRRSSKHKNITAIGGAVPGICS